ncbi:helix-turn-helix domain-containing protein [Raoultibacter massiliensis]|uniref:PucR family transcriptional regulator n=1 Tax=Raoultibacter massiliensis TaxID=1852371 RepID=UPI003A8DA1EA
MVTLALLADYLDAERVVEHNIKGRGKKLRGPRAWSSDPASTPIDYVYLVDLDEDGEPVDRGYRGKYDYVFYGRKDPLLEGLSYLYVPSDSLDFGHLYGKVQDVFELFQSEFSMRLLSAAAKNGDVEELLDIAYPFFKNPMYLADSAFMLLARTRTVEVRNPTPQWTSITQREILDPDIANNLKASDIRKLDRLRKATFIETIDAKGVRNIVAHVEKQGARIANLAVIECETPMKDYHLALADHLIDCISLAIDRQNDAQNHAGGLCERWISLLLRNEIVEESQIVPHLVKLKWDGEGCFQVAVVDFLGKPKTGTNSLNYYWGMISSMVLGHKCFIYENAIVILFHYPRRVFADHVPGDPLRDFLFASNLRGAFSEPYESVLDTAAHYEQAMRIRRLATRANPLVSHADVMVDDMIASMSFEEEWEANVYPEVVALAKQDEDGRTNLVETLYVYLLCDRSLKECSERMNIHKNTLAYRMKKIRERYALEFDDPERRLALIMSCRICLCHMRSSTFCRRLG